MENEYIRGIIKAQREFYNTGVSRDVDFRVKSLKRLRSAIMAYEDRLYEALWDDLHKSAFEGYLTEVSLVLQEIRYHIRHLKRWAAPRRVSSPFYLPGSRSRIVSEPLGVVCRSLELSFPVIDKSFGGSIIGGELRGAETFSLYLPGSPGDG